MRVPENKNYDFIPTSPLPLGVWRKKTPILNLDIDYWINQCYRISKTTPSVSRSNVHGYQSSPHLTHDLSFKPLVKLIREYFTLLTDNSNFTLFGLWVNISGENCYNTPHNHGNSLHSISGVLYLKTPPKCGRIGFLPFNDQGEIIYIEPTPGDLLLFPQNLSHFVEPNFSQEDRISIAFNCE